MGCMDMCKAVREWPLRGAAVIIGIVSWVVALLFMAYFLGLFYKDLNNYAAGNYYHTIFSDRRRLDKAFNDLPHSYMSTLNAICLAYRRLLIKEQAEIAGVKFRKGRKKPPDAHVSVGGINNDSIKKDTKYHKSKMPPRKTHRIGREAFIRESIADHEKGIHRQSDYLLINGINASRFLCDELVYLKDAKCVRKRGTDSAILVKREEKNPSTMEDNKNINWTYYNPTTTGIKGVHVLSNDTMMYVITPFTTDRSDQKSWRTTKPTTNWSTLVEENTTEGITDIRPMNYNMTTRRFPGINTFRNVTMIHRDVSKVLWRGESEQTKWVTAGTTSDWKTPEQITTGITYMYTAKESAATLLDGPRGSVPETSTSINNTKSGSGRQFAGQKEHVEPVIWEDDPGAPMFPEEFEAKKDEDVRAKCIDVKKSAFRRINGIALEIKKRYLQKVEGRFHLVVMVIDIVLVVVNCLFAAASYLLIVGARRKNRLWIVPWICASGAAIYGSLLFGLVHLGLEKGWSELGAATVAIHLIIFIVIFVIHCICLCLIMRFLKNLFYRDRRRCRE